MALYLGREGRGGSEHGFSRVALAWESSGAERELVIERGRGGGVRLLVSVGPEREEHDLELHPEGLARVNAASKLIRIEETGSSLPEAQRVPAAAAKKPAPRPTHANAQSKLIRIEEVRASIPDATIVL